jgi:HK97 family phage portal protein
MVQKRFHPSSEPPSWLRSAYGWDTNSGVEVTPETALQNMSVLSCVRLLSDVEAMLPLITYKRLERGQTRAHDYYLYPILREVSNPEMTAMTYRQTITGHVALRGNGLSEIEFDNAGRVKYLWPLNPDKVRRMERVNGKLVYIYTLPDSVGGQDVGLPSDHILHIRWFTTNGLWALSPIQQSRHSIGMSMAVQEYIARFFGNNAEPGIVLKSDKELSDKAYLRIKGDWEARHRGLENAHRLAILEDGLSVEKLGVDNKDSELLSILQYGTADIARLYGISLDMLAESDKAATYASVEQFGERFIKYTMQPWFVRWEQEISRSLLTPTERKTYFAEHLVDALLRADLATRYTAFVQGITTGFLSPNEAREKENMNPYKGGDVYLAPLNLATIDQLSQPVDGNNSTGLRYLGGADAPVIETRATAATVDDRELRSNRSAASRRRMMLSQRKVFRDTAARVLRREMRDVMDAAKKSLGKRDAQSMDLWLNQYYQRHEELVRRQFTPVMSAYADMVAGVAGDEVNATDGQFNDQVDRFVRSYINMYAARHAGISLENVRKRIQAALETEDPIAALDESLDAYQDVRADEIARLESTRENNATARMVYVAAGFVKIRWRSFNKSCPYCSNLDGAVVGVEQTFIASGESYQPEGADSPLRVNNDIGHPPAHDGCDCMITAWR